ncbi:MAG TPA: DinB family protein [Fimbriimonadaceae bacterium]|nr:DinB family protein [Fimbriimonadaceae bacterium]
MNEQIAKRFRALEERRHNLVARVKALPLDKQTRKPDENRFSPTELIMHMALAEQYDLALVKHHPPVTLKGRKPHVTWLFRKAVNSMQNPTREMPTFGPMVPKGAFSLLEADTAWEEVRQETAKFLEQVEQPSDPFMKHKFFFGLASASDYLTLIEAHLTYHERRFPIV